MHKPRLRRLESLVEILEEQLRRGQRSLPPRQLQTAQDVIHLLQEQVEAVRHEATASIIEKARALGYLAGIARKASANPVRGGSARSSLCSIMSCAV